jgi:hypothetical protein
MCVDCVLASPRIAQVDPGDEPLPEVILSQCHRAWLALPLINFSRRQVFLVCGQKLQR